MSEAENVRDRLATLLPDVNGVWRDYGPVDGPDMTCVSLTPDQADALADRLTRVDAAEAAVQRVRALLALWRTDDYIEWVVEELDDALDGTGGDDA